MLPTIGTFVKKTLLVISGKSLKKKKEKKKKHVQENHM